MSGAIPLVRPWLLAPLDKVRQVVEYAVTEIPAQKILMGLPNYGYVWRLPYERGFTQASSIGNQYAVDLAARYGAEIQFDGRPLPPSSATPAAVRAHCLV